MAFDESWIEKLNEGQRMDFLFSYTRRLLEEGSEKISLMANISSILMECLEDINRVGFYLVKDDNLILGPFQGLPATSRIKREEGICGRALRSGRLQNIYDVEEEEDHIACDSASRSELVLPLKVEGEVFALLDIDSALVGRFSKDLEEKLVTYVSEIEAFLRP